MQSLLDRRLPLRTRVDLLAADLRRKGAARELYGIRYGGGRIYLSDADFVVDRASFTFAVTEANYATDYEGAVVLDLGSHKGYSAAYAAVHGARSVLAYEPESANLAVLELTASSYRSEWLRWEIRHAAVGATAGRADLHVMGGSWGHALEPPASFAEHEVGTESVEVVALADALAEATSFRSGRARFVVKMNIEGGECPAILESPSDIWSEVDEVFVETHPWAPCDASDLAGRLEPAGLTRVASAHPAVLRMRREGSPRADPRSDPR